MFYGEQDSTLARLYKECDSFLNTLILSIYSTHYFVITLQGAPID